MGVKNMVADRHQVLGSEWTLAQDVVTELQAKWPVMVDLFATSLNYRLPVYFSPLNDPIAAGTDAFPKSWDGLQACAFLPFALIGQVINKLCTCKGTLLMLISTGMVPGPAGSLGGSSYCPTFQDRSTQAAPLSSSAPEPPRASSSCVERLQQFARHIGLSLAVARRLALSA